MAADIARQQELLSSARHSIQQNQFDAAEQAASSLLAVDDLAADLREEGVYLLAVAQRYQDKLDTALRTQGQLINAGSGYARIYQERGHTLMSMNNLPDAQRAYEKAVNLNPALVASWKALLNLYALHDGELNATLKTHQQRAQAQLEYLLALPGELVTVNSYLAEKKLFEADRLCRHFLRQNKTHIEGMRLLAQIGSEVGVLMDAQFLLETALELAPQNLRVRSDYANLLLKMQKFEPALVETKQLTEQQPELLANWALHANALAGVGDQEAAIVAYDRVLARSPGQATLLVMRGHAQKTLGNLEQAVASYQSASLVRADYGDAYWSLANTKSYRFEDAEIATMREQEARDETPVEDRIHLCFALGKAYEDAHDWQASFEFYQRGNALKQRSVGHRPEFLAIRAQAQKDVFTADFVQQRGAEGYSDPAPIFIVGLPRAGSTLLEQILASHSQVDGTLELPNIIALAQRLRGAVSEGQGDKPRYPAVLQELDGSYLHRFGEQFIEQTQVYRQGAAFFIDKNPNNFFHIGLIRLILPKAKIIDARRHPMSCCFSGFKQLFGQGQEFSYGLAEIGNYFREYTDLMEHWDRVMPGFVLRVQHEDVVDDLEGQVRRMLDFCELPFEPACLEYYKTERSVRTPSSEQVRQPIFRTALETWKHYEPWLDPLKEALGPQIRAEYGID